MSHSPLLRTVMRSVLDRRSASLTDYEIEIETACFDLHQLPNPKTFDTDGWSECRKMYESKKTRDEQRDENKRLFIKAFNQETKGVRERKKSDHFLKMRAMFKVVLPSKDAQIKLAVAHSGYPDWRPRTVADCLQGEDSFLHCAPSCGTVNIGEQGLIEWRSLHSYITPKYVPKPHFYHERRRLQDKSAEFADFVAAQAKAPRAKRIALPRPEDDTSDGGLRSGDDPDSDDEEEEEEEEVVLTQTGKGLTATKRKRGAQKSGSNRKNEKNSSRKAKKPRTRKPARFVKAFDSAALDRQQLCAQARNRFCLMQQRAPRAEAPAFELIARKARELRRRRRSERADAPAPEVEEETPEQRARRMLGVHGTAVPVDLAGRSEETGEEEKRELSAEEAGRYRRWRGGRAARAFFGERDAYVRARVYRERVPDREIIGAAQRLMGFWRVRVA